MKNLKSVLALSTILFFSIVSAQNYETKTENSGQQDKRVEVHGDLNLTYQGLDQSNVNGTDVSDAFQRPSANLDFRVKLTDGVILNNSIWVSSQHHEDTYMGFADVTVDKFNFLGLNENTTNFLNKHIRVKSGIGNPNFGDAWITRSTNAHTIDNPFQTNNLMDAFTTSLYGEAYYFFNQRDFLMVGATDGGSSLGVYEVPEGQNSGSDASLYAKAAKTFKIGNVDYRTAISGYKQLGSHGTQNLYYGDRAGYPLNSIFDGGDFGGMMGKSGVDLSSFRIDQSIKYKKFSLRGSYELSEATWDLDGDYRAETEGQMYQITAATTYDFTKKLYVGASYNYVGSDFEKDFDSSKYEAVIGYELLPKTTLKASYFHQNMNNAYNLDGDYQAAPILDGEANGILLGVNISF